MKQFLSRSEAAKFLGEYLAPTKTKTLDAMRKRGEGPRPYPRGRTIVYDRAELYVFACDRRGVASIKPGKRTSGPFHEVHGVVGRHEAARLISLNAFQCGVDQLDDRRTQKLGPPWFEWCGVVYYDLSRLARFCDNYQRFYDDLDPRGELGKWAVAA